MSLSLSLRARWAVRTATAATTAAVLTAALSTSAVAAEETSEPTVATPWISVSDVLADSLARMSENAPVAPASGTAATLPAPAEDPRILATVEKVELYEPSTRLSAIGFHEGSTRGLALTPVGELLSNGSRMNAPEDREGPGYHIMSSRGRAAGASSAIDLAMPVDEQVLSVVSGTVRSVSRYALYGATSDVLIEITPDGRPDLNVQIFHVRDVTVSAGDRVVAGETPIALPRQLPFGSQIDRIVGYAGPHVHVQVLRA